MFFQVIDNQLFAYCAGWFSVDLLESSRKIIRIGKTDIVGDFRNVQPGRFEHFPGFGQAYGADKLGRRLPGDGF